MNFADADQMLRYMDRAESTRAVGSTDMNAGSSRSHLIMALVVQKTEIVKAKGEVAKVTTGKLSLVDLAGSESAKKTSTGSHCAPLSRVTVTNHSCPSFPLAITQTRPRSDFRKRCPSTRVCRR